MNQPRELLFVALGTVLCSLAATNQLFAQAPCQTGKLLEVDLEDWALFGHAVAIDGDTAIVGASHWGIPPWHTGVAFVFRFDGLDWLLQQELLPSDGEDGDRFGGAVALDGDTIIVGAEGEGLGGHTGAAYVFRFDGKTWVEQQKLFDPDPDDHDHFARSVAISGETVFIGSHDDNEGSGSTFVYTFDGATWVLQQTLQASDADQGLGRLFGRTVAIDGGAAVIGAVYDHELGISAGAAYVFRFDGSNWIEEQKLLPSKGIDDGQFGYSVSLSNDVAVIGTRSSESAHIFNFDGSSWNQQQILVASDADPSQDFGRSVAISGDVIVVGAGEDEENGVDAGAVYLFRFDGKSWLEQKKLLPADGAPGNRFGTRVAISGETSLIGAPYDDNFGTWSGSAYVFTGLAGLDCNGNRTADACDVFAGGSRDGNGNGIPDECEGDTVGPDDFSAFRGFYVSGDQNSLLESDDDKLCYNPGIVLFPSEAPVTLDFFGTLPNDAPATLDVTIESSANTVGLELTFSFWNFNTSMWDVVGTATQSLNDDVARTFAGDPADHVEPGTGEVMTRYEVRVVSFIFLFPWLDCVDHVFWTMTD